MPGKANVSLTELTNMIDEDIKSVGKRCFFILIHVIYIRFEYRGYRIFYRKECYFTTTKVFLIRIFNAPLLYPSSHGKTLRL